MQITPIAETRCSFCLEMKEKKKTLIVNEDSSNSICYDCVKKFTKELNRAFPDAPITKEPA